MCDSANKQGYLLPYSLCLQIASQCLVRKQGVKIELGRKVKSQSHLLLCPSQVRSVRAGRRQTDLKFVTILGGTWIKRLKKNNLKFNLILNETDLDLNLFKLSLIRNLIFYINQANSNSD